VDLSFFDVRKMIMTIIKVDEIAEIDAVIAGMTIPDVLRGILLSLVTSSQYAMVKLWLKGW